MSKRWANVNLMWFASRISPTVNKLSLYSIYLWQHCSAFLSWVCWKYKQAENVGLPFLVIASVTSIVLKLMASGTTLKFLLSLLSSSPAIVMANEKQPASSDDSYLMCFPGWICHLIVRRDSFLVPRIFSAWYQFKCRRYFHFYSLSNSLSHFFLFLLKALSQMVETKTSLEWLYSRESFTRIFVFTIYLRREKNSFTQFTTKVWWHISAISRQIMMSTCQIFMLTCQLFMLTCEKISPQLEAKYLIFIYCYCHKLPSTCQFYIWQVNIIIWQVDIMIWQVDIITKKLSFQTIMLTCQIFI